MAVYPNKYNKKTDWQEGEYVTAADMNKIEQGIYDSEVYTDEAIAALVSAKQGTSAPTTSTVGTIGQKYLNTTTKDLYECIGISGNSYTWKQIYKWVAADSKYYLVDADGDEIDVSALESEIAKIVASLADAYDNAQPYVQGDIVSYQGNYIKLKLLQLVMFRLIQLIGKKLQWQKCLTRKLILMVIILHWVQDTRITF